MINLIRIDPIHVNNTMLEVMRSRYTRHDPSGKYESNQFDEDRYERLLFYQELINIRKNEMPQTVKTIEGVHAVEFLTTKLISIHN